MTPLRRRCAECRDAPWLPLAAADCPRCGYELPELGLVEASEAAAALERSELEISQYPLYETVDELLEAYFPGDPRNKNHEETRE